jgi:hypothetical protein
MLKNLKNVGILNRQCVAVLAAPIMGHYIIFAMFGVNSFGTFFTGTIDF